MVMAMCLGFGLAKGQLFVGLGLPAGFNSMPNANIPVDRFNSRAFLYRRMNHFHWPFGEIYQASFKLDRGIVMLNLNTRRQRATAKSTDNNGIYQRDVRFSMQALSLGGGYAMIEHEKFVMYFGAALDAGYMRLLTRSGPANQIAKIDYYQYRRLPMLAGSVFIKMVFRSSPDDVTQFSISPYLHAPFRDFDFQYLDQLLNQGVPGLPVINTPLYARPINVGISANFDLDLFGFLAN